MKFSLAVAAALILVGCAQHGPSLRSLHYVEGDLVYSDPPSPDAYEAYLRARLALEASPPRIEAARLAIAEALRHDTVSPHLWFTRAQIEAEAGNGEGAIACVEEALELSPEYAPARRLYAELRNDTSGSAIAKP